MSSLSSRNARDERGITVLEMVIATTILSIALVAFLASLGSSQSTSEFAASRNRSLDELRLAAAAFTREARQASSATLCATPPCSSVTLATYVDGIFTPAIVWRAEVDAATGRIELKRTDGSTTRVFAAALTSANVFAAPAVNRLKLTMATKPKTNYPPVVLETEVSLRNAEPVSP